MNAVSTDMNSQITVVLEGIAFSDTFAHYDAVVLNLASQAADPVGHSLADFLPSLVALNESYFRVQM